MMKRITTLFSLVIALSLILSACSTPEPVVQTIRETVKETVEVKVEVEKEVTKIVEVVTTPEPEKKGDKTLIVWWSHWANEPAKRIVIEKIVKDYEAEHPDVDIVLTWWDKNPLRDAVRSTMTAGSGSPDITTFDTEVVEWVEAGWLLDIKDAIPWNGMISGLEVDGSYPDLGFPGNYKLDLSVATTMVLYNPDIFAELGIEVPESNQFTQSEFVDVVKKCNQAGYAGIANGIGNRPYPAVFPVQAALFNLAGAEDFDLYNAGQKSWDTPEVRQVLDWTVQLREAGFWPPSFSTMTIDEFHIYFHTQRKACTFFIPTWYTGRGFKGMAEGGQDPDWHFKMMLYPKMDGAKNANGVWSGQESGYGILSSTKSPEVAKDILRFMVQPKYGALWTAVTNSPSAFKYDPSVDWPSEELFTELGVTGGKWDWYWMEYNRVYGSADSALAIKPRCGDFEAAVTSALNEGLPQGLISVDEAIELLDANLCK